MKKNFNIRVYGILHHQNKILTIEEPFAGEIVRKLPGGGLEIGEGTIGCLRRELKEELNLEIINIQHFYTQDFYHPSKRNKNEQILMIYYTAEIVFVENLKIIDHTIQNLHWVSRSKLSITHLSLPVDKKAIGLFLRTK